MICLSLQVKAGSYIAYFSGNIWLQKAEKKEAPAAATAQGTGPEDMDAEPSGGERMSWSYNCPQRLMSDP